MFLINDECRQKTIYETAHSLTQQPTTLVLSLVRNLLQKKCLAIRGE